MRPGELNRRVQLLRDQGGRDEFSAPTEDWQTVGSRWAHIVPGRGAERFVDDAERAAQAVTITVRYDDVTRTLGANDRVRYTDGGGQVREYDIVAPSDVKSRHEYIELLCTLRAPELDRAGS